MNLFHCKTIYIVTIVCILSVGSVVRAEEPLRASETLSETTKEFLSDPARTGSLLGSILAGAAVANPLAPLLGSVAGFIIGKNSAYSDTNSKAARIDAYNKRSLIPEAGLQVPSLSGLTGGSLLPVSDQTTIVGLSNETLSGNHSEQTDHTVVLGLPRGTVTGSQQKQINPNAGALSSSEAAKGNISENADHVLIPGLSRQTEAVGNDEHAVTLGMNVNSATGNDLQKRLAHACRNVKLGQPLSSSCYYLSR